MVKKQTDLTDRQTDKTPRETEWAERWNQGLAEDVKQRVTEGGKERTERGPWVGSQGQVHRGRDREEGADLGRF